MEEPANRYTLAWPLGFYDMLPEVLGTVSGSKPRAFFPMDSGPWTLDLLFLYW